MGGNQDISGAFVLWADGNLEGNKVDLKEAVELSDQTEIAGDQWVTLKSGVMQENFDATPWWVSNSSPLIITLRFSFLSQETINSWSLPFVRHRLP